MGFPDRRSGYRFLSRADTDRGRDQKPQTERCDHDARDAAKNCAVPGMGCPNPRVRKSESQEQVPAQGVDNHHRHGAELQGKPRLCRK